MNKDKDFEQVERIKDYWESPDTISIIDNNLHSLEIEYVSQYLESSDIAIDIGCGDGKATVEYARKVNKILGIERSDNLRSKAEKAAANSGLKNISLKSGDVMNLKNYKESFDVAVTQRMLINLSSWEDQMVALDNILNLLKPNGRYIMVENTNDSFGALNSLRSEVNLKKIPLHWHNLFFDYNQLMEFLKQRFEIIGHHDFGLYYLLTRVYVQMFSSFEGYGKKAKKDDVFEVADKAAKELHKVLNDRIKFDDTRSLGPIQVFALRKK